MAEFTPPTQHPRTKAKEIGKRILGHENAFLVIILVVMIVVIGALTKGVTTSRANISNIWLQSSIRGIASTGQLFVILTAGIDVSVGGIALVSAILGASFLTSTAEHNILGAPLAIVGTIPLVLLIGVGIGLFNGALVSRVKMPALIVTLAVWQISQGLGYVICRGITVRHLPEEVHVFGAGAVAGVPVPVITFVAIAVVSYLILNYTTFGRSIYAVGGNPVSAFLSGVNVSRVKLAVYAISGCLAALAGFITMSRVMSAGMGTIIGLELDSIAAVCIGGTSLMGGRGNVIGMVIGVLILGVISNGLNVIAVDPAYQMITRGAIILVAVAADYIRRRD